MTVITEDLCIMYICMISLFVDYVDNHVQSIIKVGDLNYEINYFIYINLLQQCKHMFCSLSLP